jgi:hypothetical protein
MGSQGKTAMLAGMMALGLLIAALPVNLLTLRRPPGVFVKSILRGPPRCPACGGCS